MTTVATKLEYEQDLPGLNNLNNNGCSKIERLSQQKQQQ